VLIPSLQKERLVLLYQSLKLINFTTRKTVIRGQLRRIQPELRLIFGSLNMNMRRLSALVAEKVELKSANS